MNKRKGVRAHQTWVHKVRTTCKEIRQALSSIYELLFFLALFASSVYGLYKFIMR